MNNDEPLWYESRFGRLLGWVDDVTPGRFPWAHIWMRNRWAFHFASGHGGFAVSFPLPAWLPGFVREYQVDGPRRFWRGERCEWWRESSLTLIVPFLPPGRPIASRTRRLRRVKTP